MLEIFIYAAIIFCLFALIREDFPQLFSGWADGKRGQSCGCNYHYESKEQNNSVNMNDIYCPECGSPNVTVYDDGSCVCEDCQFEFHIDYLR